MCIYLTLQPPVIGQRDEIRPRDPAGRTHEIHLGLRAVNHHLGHVGHGAGALKLHRFVLVQQLLQRHEQMIAQVYHSIFHSSSSR